MLANPPKICIEKKRPQENKCIIYIFNIFNFKTIQKIELTKSTKRIYNTAEKRKDGVKND